MTEELSRIALRWIGTHANMFPRSVDFDINDRLVDR